MIPLKNQFLGVFANVMENNDLVFGRYKTSPELLKTASSESKSNSHLTDLREHKPTSPPEDLLTPPGQADFSTTSASDQSEVVHARTDAFYGLCIIIDELAKTGVVVTSTRSTSHYFTVDEKVRASPIRAKILDIRSVSPLRQAQLLRFISERIALDDSETALLNSKIPNFTGRGFLGMDCFFAHLIQSDIMTAAKDGKNSFLVNITKIIHDLFSTAPRTLEMLLMAAVFCRGRLQGDMFPQGQKLEEYAENATYCGLTFRSKDNSAWIPESLVVEALRRYAMAHPNLIKEYITMTVNNSNAFGATAKGMFCEA